MENNSIEKMSPISVNCFLSCIKNVFAKDFYFNEK